MTNVRQLGVDRIVDFEFAGGEKSLGFHIIVEFYAAVRIIKKGKGRKQTGCLLKNIYSLFKYL